jgi:hypothetical protein
MSLESPNTQLAEWVAKHKKVEIPAVVPVEETKVIDQPTEESSKPLAQETPKEQPKEEPTTATTEEKVAEVGSSWDADEAQTTTVETPKFDFNKIGSALDLKEIKSEDEIVAKVSELRTKLKQLEESPLSGIPEDFKEVIEITKSGVDWKDYLSNQIIDYTKVDPDQLFEDEFFRDAVRNPKFFTDGKFDQAKADEAIDAIPESLRTMYGKQIAQGKAQEQRQRQLELKARAEAKIAQAEKSLSSATKNLNELLPVESYGIKFEPKHSSEIYQGISSSKLTRKHLGVDYESLVKSGADMKAVARTVAAAEYAEKMVKFKAQTAKVEAKKEVLDRIQNPQIRSTGSVVQPESETEKKLTPAEKLAFHLKNTRKGL